MSDLISFNGVIFVCMYQQACDLDGEIDLSSCYNVTEYQAQRNYGFQIHVSVSKDIVQKLNPDFFFSRFYV